MEKLSVTVTGVPESRTYVFGPKAVNVSAESGTADRTTRREKSPVQNFREQLGIGYTALQQTQIVGA